MAGKSSTNEPRGYAGFQAFAGEFDIKLTDPATIKDAEAAEPAAKQTAGDAKESKGGVFEAPLKKAKAGGIWWLVIGGIILWVIAADDGKKSTSSNYTSPSSSYSDSSSYNDTTESVPLAGTNNVLSRAEIRYCLSEKIRSQAIEPLVNTYSDAEVNYFNGRIADYNSRCGSFRYQTSTFNSVQSQVNASRSTIYQGGVDQFNAWRGAAGSKKNTETTNPKVIWGKPTVLQGFYHQKTFKNCCFQGVEREQPYNDLTLLAATDFISGTSHDEGDQPNVSHVQVSIGRDISKEFKDGEIITVNCKSVWAGSTGHYALPTYCEAESVKSVSDKAASEPAAVPTTVNPKNKLEQEIADASGVTLTRVSKFGDAISTTGGYVGDSKFKILLNGTELLTDDSSAYMEFKYHTNIAGDDVILVEKASGGNACPSEQVLIVVSKGMPVLTKDFGNCNAPEITQPSPGQLTFTFVEGYGQRLVVDYKNRKLIERKVSLPLHVDSASSDGNFEYLKQYVDSTDVEPLVLDSKLQPILLGMMGADFQMLLDRLKVFSKPTVSNGYFVFSACMPHSCNTDQGIIVVALDGSEVWSAVLETEFSPDYKISTAKVRAYSNRAATDWVPEPLTKWIKDIDKAQVTWKYAN